jgi:hypothetical protein
MNKEAFVRGYLEKAAGLTSELIGSSVVNPLNLSLGSLIPVGAAASMVTPTETKPQQVESAKETATNFIPGVAYYRLGKRLGRSVKDMEDLGAEGARGRMLSEQFGAFTSPVAATAGGAALLGSVLAAIALMKGRSRADVRDAGVAGAGVGATIGWGLGSGAQLIGALSSMLPARRDDKQQLAYEKAPGGTLKNLLVPGVSAYNLGRRLGYTRKYDDKATEQERQDRRIQYVKQVK